MNERKGSKDVHIKIHHFESLTHIINNYRLSDEVYAVYDEDSRLQLNLETDGYRIQQCTNHFVRTSIYYLWMEQYPKVNRMRKNDIIRIISILKNSVKKHRKDSDFSRLKWRKEKTQEELLVIANELLSKNKNSNAANSFSKLNRTIRGYIELKFALL